MAANVIAAGGDPNNVNVPQSVDGSTTSTTTATTTLLVDPNGGLIHPALRGVKTVNIGECDQEIIPGVSCPNCSPITAGGIGMARKRPLLGGVPRSTMNPTKRTVMTLLARAKNAQQLHSNRLGMNVVE